MDLSAVPETLSVNALLFNLLVGTILSVLLAWYYARFGESLSNRVKFARLLPMLCLIVILVISIIKASLALSLGLVGALSIVRFRTAIKDPEELLYLFLAIAIGVGLGANQWVVTLVAVGVIMALLVATRLVAPRSERRNLYLNIQIPDGEGEDTATFKSLNELLATNIEMADMRRLDYHDDTLQLTYLLNCRNLNVVVSLMDDLRKTYPGCSFTFVNQDGLPSS